MTDTLQSGAESALDLPIFCYAKQVHPGWPEFNKADEFSDGEGGGEALVKLSDVRAALARRATAPHAAKKAKPSTVQNLLHWALGELLGALPERRDWFNPDAEKVLRAVRDARPVAAEPVVPAVGSALVASTVPVLYVRQIDLDSMGNGRNPTAARQSSGDWNIPVYLDAPTESAAAPADTLEQMLMDRRIGLTPENEGGWHATVYGDGEEPAWRGYANTPSGAIADALAPATQAEGK